MKSWDPFRDLVTIQDRMNKLFESVLSGPVEPGVDVEGVGYWRPVSDVVQSEDAIEIECELAGLDLADVEVTVDGAVVSIRGERKRPATAAGWRFHRLERPHGTFLRRFEMPEDVDLDHLESSLEHGVLRLIAPRRVASGVPRTFDN